MPALPAPHQGPLIVTRLGSSCSPSQCEGSRHRGGWAHPRCQGRNQGQRYDLDVAAMRSHKNGRDPFGEGEVREVWPSEIDPAHCGLSTQASHDGPHGRAA